MKKSVLLFVSLMLAAVSAIAQPAKPTVTYSDWVEETDIYLYNVEAGMFLVGSNNWGTRAALVGGGSNSNIITYDKFLAGNGTIKGTKWQIIQAEDKREQTACFQLSNTEIAGRGLIPSGANECWVDGGPAHGDASLRDIDGWYIAKDNGNKTFQLNFSRKSAKKDEAGNEIKVDDQVVYEYTPATGVLCANKFADGELNVNIAESGAYGTWAVVTVDEYNRVVPLFNLYYAGVGLQKVLDDAKALGIDSDLSEYENLLKKADVTLEELQAATKKVSPAVDFGKVIKSAKEADPARDWSKYEAIYANPESTDADFTNNTKLIDAFLALKKALDEAKELDAAKVYAQAQALYIDDEAALADIEAETKRVNAFVSLKKALDEATSKGCNVTDYATVYNNADATAEALAEAEEKVKDIITTNDIAEAAKDATAENPADFTSYIVNPTFDTIGDFHGWTGPFGAGGTKSTNAEVYGKSFDCYQDIKNMPAGVYMIACNGYTRYQNQTADYNAWKAGQVSETKIYLKGETNGQYFTPIKHVSEGGAFSSVASEEVTVKLDEEWGTITTGGAVTLYTPNTMAAAEVYFHKSGEGGTASDRYRNEAYGPLGEGDVLRIGVYNSKATGSDWSIFDDFQLFYLGNGADAYKKWAESVKGNYNVSFDGEVYYGAPDRKNYEDILATLTEASDKDAVSAAILNVDAAVEKVAASKENYATYVATLATVETWLGQNVGDDDSYYRLSDYMEAESAEDVADWEFPNGPAKVIIPDYQAGGFVGILSAEDIATETEFLKGMLAEATRNTLADGSDLTSLITNPGFEENLVDGKAKGWSLDTSKGGTSSLTNWRGGNSDNYCAEAYQQNFDVYQEIEGVKDGLYEVSVQAFYRGGWPEAAWNNYKNDPEMKGDAKVYSEVYFNEFATPIRNVMEITFDSNLADNCSSFAVEGEGDDAVNVFVPNGMASASAAFSLPDNNKNYTMSAYGLVTDGKIRLGIRRLTTPPSNDGTWTLWDNFKLTYRAKNPEVVAKVLESKSQELGELLDNEGDNLTEPAKDAATYAYKESTKTGLSDAAKYEVLIETNDALVAAKANVEKVSAYKTAKDAYDTAVDKLYELDEDKKDEIWAKVDEMDSELDGDAYYTDLTTEEVSELTGNIEKLTEDVNAAIEAIKEAQKKADMASATDEDPYDATSWIVNPDMEDSSQDSNSDSSKQMAGWDFWKAKGNGPVKGSGGISGRSLEAWSGTVGADLEFSAYQTITGLPAGKYELSAKAANASNDVASDVTLWNDPETAAKGRAYLCAITSNGESEKAVSTPVEPNIGSATEAQTYTVVFTLAEGEDVKIGFQSIGTMPFRWFMCDDFTLTYYGTASAKTDSTDEGGVVKVEGVEEAADTGKEIVGYFNAAGTQIESLQPGINIVKYADGTSRKIFVK